MGQVSKVNYFLVGLGIGSLIGILYAPKSGEETREYLTRKAKEASRYAEGKMRDMSNGAEGLMQRGKKVVAQKQQQISTAIEAGREAYQREKSRGARRMDGGMA
jgi:gas vesicle protein